MDEDQLRRIIADVLADLLGAEPTRLRRTPSGRPTRLSDREIEQRRAAARRSVEARKAAKMASAQKTGTTRSCNTEKRPVNGPLEQDLFGDTAASERAVKRPVERSNGKVIHRISTELSTGLAESPQELAWRSYSIAFKLRYGEFPPRNQRTNAQLARFVKLVPAADAPGVAEWYLRVDDPAYVRAMHPVGLLLRDADKLYTMFKTGATVAAASPVPAAKPWWDRWQGIVEMGERLGVEQMPDAPQAYRMEVLRMAAACGELPEDVARKLGVEPL